MIIDLKKCYDIVLDLTSIFEVSDNKTELAEKINNSGGITTLENDEGIYEKQYNTKILYNILDGKVNKKEAEYISLLVSFKYGQYIGIDGKKNEFIKFFSNLENREETERLIKSIKIADKILTYFYEELYGCGLFIVEIEIFNLVNTWIIEGNKWEDFYYMTCGIDLKEKDQSKLLKYIKSL